MIPHRIATARRLVRITAQPDPADTLALIRDAIADCPAGTRIEVGWGFDALLLDPPRPPRVIPRPRGERAA